MAPDKPAPPPAQRPLTLIILRVLWPFLVLTALVTAARFILTGRRNSRRRAQPVGATSREPPLNHPKRWEDAIAARLDKLHRPQLLPTEPPVTTAPSSAIPDELTLELLRQLEWKRLELLTALYFRATGIRAECTCDGSDGGIDVKLSRLGEARPFSYIQCKAWGTKKTPITDVRELLGVMAADGVKEGVFFTTSDFWPDARAFAQANGIVAMTPMDFLSRFNALSTDQRRDILVEVTAGDYTTPSCPACTARMVWKENAGFWGCPKYPRCRSKPIYPRAA